MLVLKNQSRKVYGGMGPLSMHSCCRPSVVSYMTKWVETLVNFGAKLDRAECRKISGSTANGKPGFSNPSLQLRK